MCGPLEKQSGVYLVLDDTKKNVLSWLGCDQLLLPSKAPLCE